MAGLVYSVVAGSTALVAATAKTAIEVGATATGGFVITQLSITFNGVTASAIPVTCDITTFAATGTGTGYTPNKISHPNDRVAATTAEINCTVEPATPTVIDSFFLPPTSGYTIQYPLGREKRTAASGFLGIRLTALAVVNYIVTLYFEE